MITRARTGIERCNIQIRRGETWISHNSSHIPRKYIFSYTSISRLDMYIYIYIREKFRRIYFLAGEEEGRRNVEEVWNTGISTKTNVHRISSSPIREGPRRGCSHLEVSDRDRRSCERRSRAWRPSAAAETGHELARDHKLRLRFLSCSWPIHFTYRCLSFPLSLSRTVLLLLLGRSSPAPASPPRLSSPSSRLHAPTPPTASGHRPTVAAFSAVYAAALCAGLCAAWRRWYPARDPERFHGEKERESWAIAKENCDDFLWSLFSSRYLRK